jgi:hypothetical protein
METRKRNPHHDTTIVHTDPFANLQPPPHNDREIMMGRQNDEGEGGGVAVTR